MLQTIATKVFMIASVTFGITGISLVILAPTGNADSTFITLLSRLLFICVFIILSSFALSVACKYLLTKPRHNNLHNIY